MSQNITISGRYHDRLYGPDGELLHDAGWRSNSIVYNCRVLLAAFVHNDGAQGIRYLAVGRGRDEWDLNGPPEINPAITVGLENAAAETIPVDQLEIGYLNERDEEVGTPTTRLRVKATLPPNFPAPIGNTRAYPLREFGLFGKIGNQAFMINCVRHRLIQKDETATLIREVRLQF